MKLVRDKIPQIIKKTGKRPQTHIATKKEYQQALINKLQEELNELKKDKNTDEIADLVEVAYALAGQYGKNEKQLNQIRKQKNKQKGKFTKKIILEKIN